LGKFDGDLMMTEERWQLTVPTWLSKCWRLWKSWFYCNQPSLE